MTTITFTKLPYSFEKDRLCPYCDNFAHGWWQYHPLMRYANTGPILQKWHDVGHPESLEGMPETTNSLTTTTVHYEVGGNTN